MPSSRPKRTWSTTTKQHQTQESQIVAKTGVTPHAKKKRCVCVFAAAYLDALVVAGEYVLSKICIFRLYLSSILPFLYLAYLFTYDFSKFK